MISTICKKDVMMELLVLLARAAGLANVFSWVMYSLMSFSVLVLRINDSLFVSKPCVFSRKAIVVIWLFVSPNTSTLFFSSNSWVILISME